MNLLKLELVLEVELEVGSIADWHQTVLAFGVGGIVIGEVAVSVWSADCKCLALTSSASNQRS